MSIAWAGLVLVVLLLPGLLFFVGALFLEQFTRDAEQRSPLGHLGGVLSVSFAIHGLLYVLSQAFCGGSIPCVDVAGLLTILNASPQWPGSIAKADSIFREHGFAILLYVVFTSLAGAYIGYRYAKLVINRKVRALTRHPWIYDLTTDGLTYAYVLTHIRHNELVLMYRGFVLTAGLQLNGTFSYLVLKNVTRYYMRLEDEAPVTSVPDAQRVIGESRSMIPGHEPMKDSTLFVIEGEDMANVVFSRLAIKNTAIDSQEFLRLLKLTVESFRSGATQTRITDPPAKPAKKKPR